MDTFCWTLLSFLLGLSQVYCQGPDICPQMSSVCPEIPPDCRKAQFMIGFDQQTRCRLCDSNLCGDHRRVCPAIDCLNDHKIKDECRRPNFVIGSDNITVCRLCDSSVCGKEMEVCPHIQCPNDNTIPNRCRMETFAIGTDGITLCRLCDRDGCLGL